MLIPRDVFALAQASTDDVTRFNLGGVHFKRTYGGTQLEAYATDGKMLGRVKWTEDPPEDFPEVSGVKATEKPGFETTLPRSACATVRKAIPKRTLKPILGNAVLDEQSSNGTIPMATTDLESPQKFEPKPCEGPFPDAAGVLRDSILKDAPRLTMKFNPAYLLQAIKTMMETAGVTARELPTCTMTIRNPEKPVVFEMEAQTYVGEVLMAVMPVVTTK